MTYRSAQDILAEAAERGMRRALFVTALPLEMDAVRGHLESLGSVADQRYGTVYECGKFSYLGKDWLVVVTETGSGTHPAHSAVTCAHNLFQEFEVQILVGIGGSRKSDAPIGSVVASDNVYMPYGGKYAEGARSSRPRTFPVDRRLINIARKVCRDKEWPLRIRDREGGILPQPDNYPTNFPPIGLVAPVASVEAVLADRESELEALIADVCGDACVVEMEGYGAVYAASQERVPSILVRGVSDMIQDKSPEKDAERQPVAARHAAAFAFELLSHWTQVFPAIKPHMPGAMPTPAGGRTEVVTEPAATESGPDHADTPTTREVHPDVVLNIDEAYPANLAARLSEIETLLRKIVKSDAVTATGADAGSLHVFVSDPDGTLRKFGAGALRTAFAERNDPELLGMVDMAKYKSFAAVRDQLERASLELKAWPSALPGGEKIERPELAQLIERLDSSISSTTAVLGSPGAGKSALLSTLADRFADRGWPVLAIKGDLLDPNISDEEDLQQHLGFEASPSDLLLRLAEFQPVLLILDQLDALAGYLDLRTSRLSILLSLVRKLGRTDNIHIVLSSRIFEFEHDVRLKYVSTESITLELPAWSKILALLEARGIHAAGWPMNAQEVMRTPQALAIYLQLKGKHDSEAFTSYQAMLEKLWSEQILVGKGASRRALLATEIAEIMAKGESLWLASAKFDDREEDIAALEAAGVLTRADGRVGFTHQTLFEYALARSFAREKGRLSAYVLKRQTSLFLRPKLLAGLNYLRDREINTYHSELEAIWSAHGLRKHLRFLLIDFLGHQTRPTDREALMMEQALRHPEQLWPAYQALRGSPGWFERFCDTFIAEGMCASEEAANAVTDVLSRAWPFAEENVVRLLQERWAPDPNQDTRTGIVLQNAPRWTEAAQEIACTIVGRMDIAPLDIDHVVATVGVKQPQAAFRLVRARLDHELAVAEAEAEKMANEEFPKSGSLDAQIAWSWEKDPRIPLNRLVENSQAWESLPALAEQAPAAFLEVLWPWFEKYFDALKAQTEERQGGLGYAPGPDADFWFDEECEEGRSEPELMAGLRTAAESLCKTDPDAWLVWVARLKELNMKPSQRLIAHCFALQPAQFAAQTLDFLLDDPRRYVLGSISDQTGTTSRLVKAASKHWSEQGVARFEAAISSYKPPAPPDLTEAGNRRSWDRGVRKIKLSLLRSLPKHRLNARTRRHVEGEERVFPESRFGTRSIRGGFIGPMMDAAAMARASDEDLINAFCTVPDASGWDHPRKLMVGGNIQLSREFATFAKNDPVRAIHLLGSLSPENGTRAAGYALDAMSENTSPDQVLQLFRDVVGRGFDNEEFRHSASQAIVRLVDRKAAIGNNIVALLEGWLAAPPTAEVAAQQVAPDTDPDTGEETANTDLENQEDGIQRSLLWGQGGISMVPGGQYPVIEALTRIRLERREDDRIDEMMRVYLDRCKDPDVWTRLLRFLPYLHPNDPPRRAALLELLFLQVPTLVGSREAAHILANAHWWNADFADAQLDRWRDSESRLARQAYGEIVAVAALIQPELPWAQTRLETLVESQAQEDARAGAALTAANLWTDAKRHSSAAALLTRLLAAGGKGVWKATFEVFRLADELIPDSPTVSLLTMIADRLENAPRRLYTTFVVERLATLLPHQAQLVGRVAKGLIAAWRAELGDPRTATAFAAPQLIDLAVTLHRLGPETREIGTTLFEELIEADAWEARRTRDEIDNKFLEQAPPRRRRLARRKTARNRGRRRHRADNAT